MSSFHLLRDDVIFVTKPAYSSPAGLQWVIDVILKLSSVDDSMTKHCVCITHGRGVDGLLKCMICEILRFSSTLFDSSSAQWAVGTTVSYHHYTIPDIDGAADGRTGARADGRPPCIIRLRSWDHGSSNEWFARIPYMSHRSGCNPDDADLGPPKQLKHVTSWISWIVTFN
jgi:hypothetical protein